MIKFFRGPRGSFNLETHGQGIYFATDTHEILHGEHSYSGLLAVGKSVKDITLEEGILTITYTDGSNTTAEIGSGKYQSKIEDGNVAMTTAYGDYGVGTKVSDLNGKSYDELFDGILFPTINPTHTNGSLTGFVLNPSSSPVELGTTVASISEAGMSKGKWTTYNNNMAYEGDVTSIAYEFKINGTTYTAISDLADKTYTSLGNHTYKATISYGAGEAPKNNKGVVVESLACSAGSLSPTTRTVNVTAPWFASTVTSGELTKQSLVSWNATAGAMASGEFELQPHTAAAPQMFKLPRKATSLEMYNTVAKAYETVSLTDWNEVSAAESLNGIDHTYYTYAYKGNARGSVKLKVKF